MQNPAAIHMTRKPITKNKKVLRMYAVSSETSALATEVKNKKLIRVPIKYNFFLDIKNLHIKFHVSSLLTSDELLFMRSYGNLV